jgi:hypothetical protein
VFRGVGVNVAVEVDGGMAVTVCADAASAVWAMNIFIAFESRGGIGVGVANEGTHPIISARVMNPITSFILTAVMFPLNSRT